MSSMPAVTAAPLQHHGQAAQLAEACHALWLATLSLMTAFMRTSAPAHRLMLARRIVRNFDTLRQETIFDRATRDSFDRMHARWQKRVRLLTPEGEQQEVGALGWLRRLLPR